MHKITQLPGRTVTIDATEHLWFGGTAYLGMQHNADFQSLIERGFAKYGANWGSSRNNNLQLAIYEQLEGGLASFVGAEGALTVSSGMLAGQLVVHNFEKTNPNHATIFAPKVHPALWGKNFVANNQSFQHFSENINNQIADIKQDTIIIYSDSVASPTIEYFDFEWVINLPTDKKIYMVIDDSHSLGIFGQYGNGIYSQIKHKTNVNLIVISSLNKAFGIPGGIIFAKDSVLNCLKTNSIFTASSPISPAFAYACANAGNIYKQALILLQNNIKYFHNLIENLGEISHLPSHPTYCLLKKGIIEYLAKNKIIVPNFAYPSPTDSPINRLVISSLHTKTDLENLAYFINQFHKI